jgi:hypothetical protein
MRYRGGVVRPSTTSSEKIRHLAEGLASRFLGHLHHIVAFAALILLGLSAPREEQEGDFQVHVVRLLYSAVERGPEFAVARVYVSIAAEK